jgi:hypothetical protein
VPPDGRVLGVEPLNVMFGQLDHSWLCNRVEKYCASALHIRPDVTGFSPIHRGRRRLLRCHRAGRCTRGTRTVVPLGSRDICLAT